MKDNEKKLFEKSDVDPKNSYAVLSLILAAPQAIADEIGVEGAIRCAVEAAMGMSKERVYSILSFKPPKLGMGALDPKDMPGYTPPATMTSEELKKLPPLPKRKGAVTIKA